MRQGNLPEDLIDASLDAAQQSLLTSLKFQDDLAIGRTTRKRFLPIAAVAVSNFALKQRLKEIDQLEEEARSNNDEAGLMKYLRERMEINQKLKKKL